MSRPLSVAALTAALLLSALSVAAPGGVERVEAGVRAHLELSRSVPEADATVTSPAEVRLWFSQAPQAGATSARLIRRGTPVEAMGKLQVDPDDATVFAAGVDGTLTPGVYTISWRAMAADGHVVRGDFDFTVSAPQQVSRRIKHTP